MISNISDIIYTLVLAGDKIKWRTECIQNKNKKSSKPNFVENVTIASTKHRKECGVVNEIRRRKKNILTDSCPFWELWSRKGWQFDNTSLSSVVVFVERIAQCNYLNEKLNEWDFFMHHFTSRTDFFDEIKRRWTKVERMISVSVCVNRLYYAEKMTLKIFIGFVKSAWFQW